MSTLLLTVPMILSSVFSTLKWKMSSTYSAAERGECEKLCEAFSTVPAHGTRSINGACRHSDCERISHVSMYSSF